MNKNFIYFLNPLYKYSVSLKGILSFRRMLQQFKLDYLQPTIY